MWLVRIDDVDTPRNVPGASDQILRTLEGLGLWWDEDVVYQSQRGEHYRRALELLAKRGATFACGCSRRELAGAIYPGTCRNGLPPGKQSRSRRVVTADTQVTFIDGWQGRFEQNLSREIGDFIVLRGDNQVAYHLATAVDDAAQNITEVVRGSDLLDSTPRQIHLQRLLSLPTPDYCHHPVATNRQGRKLSKQTHALPIDTNRPRQQAWWALEFLGQDPPSALAGEALESLWSWAIRHWDIARIPGEREITADYRALA